MPELDWGMLHIFDIRLDL